MQLDQKQIILFQEKILAWYAMNQRDLPWRKTRDPYAILVSEVMSQQTQITRVVVKYEAWIKRFPTVFSLANSSVSEVLQYWSGLGYNRRALHLKKTAEIIVRDYHGVFPQTEKELISLPGIGKYTAQAILCFAFDQQVAVVDTNVRKVILTQFVYRHPERSEGSFLLDSSPLAQNDKVSDKELGEIAQQLLPEKRAYEWNQALMDYASAVLKNEKIPIPKQSTFVGSHRYYRGQVLKVLLQRKRVSQKEIGFLIKKDFSVEQTEWLMQLLQDLQKEGFIRIVDENVILSGEIEALSA